MKTILFLYLMLSSLYCCAESCGNSRMVVLYLQANDPIAAGYYNNICVTANGITKDCGQISSRCESLLGKWKLTTSKLKVVLKRDKACDKYFNYIPFSSTTLLTGIHANLSWDTVNQSLYLSHCINARKR